MKRYLEPIRARSTGDVVDADHLPKCRRRPVRIVLHNAIDCHSVNVDKFARSGTNGIDAVDLCVGILHTWARGGTDPIVLSNDHGCIGEWIAVWRTAKVGSNTGSFVVFRDLVSV